MRKSIMAILNRKPKKTKNTDDNEDDAKENQVILFLNSFSSIKIHLFRMTVKKMKTKKSKKTTMKKLVNQILL